MDQPGSFQEVLLARLPPLIEELQRQGGPTDAQVEEARAFTPTLGSRGDALLFPLNALKDRDNAEELLSTFCRHIAVAAFCPGGLALFGLRVVALPEHSLMVKTGSGCIGQFPTGVLERKTTGSFYTPMDLVECLLDSALNPIIDDACAADDPDHALLSLRVADPCCGSGVFSMAAAHRLAKRLASIRYGTQEPSLAEWRAIHRAIVARCLFAVDLNPAAVELCKVTLSLQAIDPGKSFPYLDAHIQHGNGILGTDFALMQRGIPDAALNPIQGDDPVLARAYKKRNKAEREGQRGLFAPAEQDKHLPDWDASHKLLVQAQEQLEALPDDTVAYWNFKRAAHHCLLESDLYRWNLLRANAWCAAFVWKKTSELPDAITEAVFRTIERDPAGVAPWMRDEINRLAEEYHFFHWDIAFAQVLYGHAHFMEAERTRQRAWVEQMERRRA